MSNGNNKTNKTHRDLLKNAKRNSDGLNYNTQPSVSDSSSRGNMNVTVDTVNLNKPKKSALQWLQTQCLNQQQLKKEDQVMYMIQLKKE